MDQGPFDDMNYVNDYWQQGLTPEGEEYIWSEYSEPCVHRAETTTLNNITPQHGQTYDNAMSSTPGFPTPLSNQTLGGSTGEAITTCAVSRVARTINQVAPSLLSREQTTTSSPETAPSDSAPIRRTSSDEHQNLDTILVVYRLRGSDVMSFSCKLPGCTKRYTRWHDFLRHYDGVHAIIKKEFWCPVNDCNRNETHGDNPFPRKDKMREHVRKVHPCQRRRRT